jgi:trk system potassium uptake protein TrkH
MGLLSGRWFTAIVYSLAAVSTGGFSPQQSSLAGLPNQPLQVVVILFATAGAVSLVLYPRLFREGWRVALKDRQLQGFFIACLLTTLLLAWFLWMQSGYQWCRALGHGALNAFSAQSTAGFSSIDISELDAGSKLVLVFSMLSGGSIGSTAGGIKILRLLILIKVFVLLVQRAGMPLNAMAEKRLGGRRLKPDELQDALCIVIAFGILIAISWLPFVTLGHDPLASLFEVVSAVGTVGLSAGITTPSLHPFLKAVLAADMLLGRLEILAWLVFLAPGTWIGNRLEE